MAAKKVHEYEIVDCIAAKGKLRQIETGDTVDIDPEAEMICFRRTHRNRIDIERKFQGQRFERDQNFRGEWRQLEVGGTKVLVGFLGRKRPPGSDDDDDDMDVFVAVGTPNDPD